MTNAEKFKQLFGIYATELWAMPEEKFLEWLNAEALEKQEQTNTQNINSTHTSRPNALESLNILEQAKDEKGHVPMSLVRQAFRNVIEQAVDKSCKTCKHRKLSAWEKPCNRCYFASGVLKDGYEPYTEEKSMIVYCDADDCKWNEDGKCKGPVQPAGHTALYIRQNWHGWQQCDDFKDKEEEES